MYFFLLLSTKNLDLANMLGTNYDLYLVLNSIIYRLGSDYKQDKEVMVGSSKRKNLPHCSNLKVRHKAPKTTKYVPLRHSQPQNT